MSVKLTSYINFNGNAKEALEFYESVFGGKISGETFREFVQRVPDSGMPVTDLDMDKLMHASLMGENGIEIMASDVPSDWPPAAQASQITLTLNGDDETTLREYWGKLSEGGTVTMPLDRAPWGDIFGSLTDKFGINWMVNIGPEQQA